MQYLKNLKWEMILFSVLSIVFGLLMVFYPAKIMNAVCIVLAVILFLFGIKNLVEYRRNSVVSNYYKYELVLGIVFIITGIIVLTKMDAILSFVTYLIGVIVLISGLMKVQDAVELRRMGSRWIPLLVFAILCILLSVMVLTMPMNHNDNGTKTAGDFMIQCAGAILAVTGLIDLITTLAVSSKIKIWTIERSEIYTEDDVTDVDYEEID